MRGLVAAALLACGPLACSAQDWSPLSPMLAQTLDVMPGESGPILVADHPDPGVASLALGFHYYGNRDGGNAIELNIGLYQRQAAGWVYLGRVEQLYGTSPRDPAFPPGRIELTTTTLGPDDPRCCPTGEARWSIDVATRQVTKLR